MRVVTIFKMEHINMSDKKMVEMLKKGEFIKGRSILVSE